MNMRFTNFAWRRGNTLTADEVRLLCDSGLVYPAEARGVLLKLHQDGAFEAPLDQGRRALLAALTRAAELKPRLAVDNTRPAQRAAAISKASRG